MTQDYYNKLLFQVFKALEATALQLDERKKELTCIREISRLFISEKDLDTLLTEAARTIPGYWQYPEVACARIKLEGREYCCPRFKDSKIKIARDVVIDSEKTGKIEVCYLEERPPFDDGPFMEEEKQLLETICYHLANLVKLKQKEEALASSADYFYITLHSIGDAVITTDTRGKITFMNPMAESMTGWSFASAQERDLVEVFYILNAHTRERVADPVAKVLQTGEKKNLANDTVLISSTGREYQISDSAAPIVSYKGVTRGVVLVFSDITEKYKTEQKLKRREEKYRALVNQSAEMLFLHDLEGRILEVNQAAIRKTGYAEAELLNMRVFDLHPESDQYQEVNPPQEILRQWQEMSIGGEPLNLETRHVHKDGTVCPVEVTLNKVTFGNGTYMLALVRDIRERKQYEEQLMLMSLYDELTGLYNRAYLEEEMRRLENAGTVPTGIIIVDIDGLKMINENYSYTKGDKYIKGLADILQQACQDHGIAARWGSDEFVLLLPGMGEKHLEKLLNYIRNKCQHFVSSTDFPLKISVGTEIKESSQTPLKRVLQEAEDNLQKNKLVEDSSARSDTIAALSGILKEKSDETEEHARRMLELGLRFGRKLNLSEQEMNRLSLLASLHDIGKVTLPEGILKKPGGLSREEWEAIKSHPERGRRIASYSNNLQHIAKEIATHHERWDGKGYPYGLQGEAIPYLARIIAIIDTYDVMTNGRSYKSAVSSWEALKEIQDCAGTQFDPRLASKFVDMMQGEREKRTS